MKNVNIYPTQNATIKLPNWEISSPILSVSLSNEEIYQCINQKAMVYEILPDGKTVLITLSNIKIDLAHEAEIEAEEKRSEVEKLNTIIENLRREIVDIKEDHIFNTFEEAIVYSSSTLSTVGETISVLNIDKTEYILYTISPDKTLAPVSKDSTTVVQDVSQKIGDINTKILELEDEILELIGIVEEFKNNKTIFESLEEASDFALDVTKSKTGELITVNIDGSYIVYIINIDRTVKPLTSNSIVTVIQ